MTARICVLGAGVIGLSTAVNIIEQLHQKYGIDKPEVHLISAEFSPNTTGDGSAGFWTPYQVGTTPSEHILNWGGTTLRYMEKLSRSAHAAQIGAFTIGGYMVFKETPQLPIWKDIVPGFRVIGEEEMKQFPNFKYGFAYTTAVVECTKYLPWLQKRFTDMGGKIFQKRINSIEQLHPIYDIVVNCTGMGSHSLLDDSSLQPISGQVMRVKAPWVKSFLIADNFKIYILPGSEEVVLGGTLGKGNWSLEVNKQDKNNIWKGCLDVLPSLQHSEHILDWVGLRPYRPQIRLENEEVELPNGKVHIIHNYGHAGAGVSLHWGCALEATKLVMKAIDNYKGKRLSQSQRQNSKL